MLNSCLKGNKFCIVRCVQSTGKMRNKQARGCIYSAQRFEWYWMFDGKMQWVKPNQIQPLTHMLVETEMCSLHEHNVATTQHNASTIAPHVVLWSLLNSSVFSNFVWYASEPCATDSSVLCKRGTASSQDRKSVKSVVVWVFAQFSSHFSCSRNTLSHSLAAILSPFVRMFCAFDEMLCVFNNGPMDGTAEIILNCLHIDVRFSLHIITFQFVAISMSIAISRDNHFNRNYCICWLFLKKRRKCCIFYHFIGIQIACFMILIMRFCMFSIQILQIHQIIHGAFNYDNLHSHCIARQFFFFIESMAMDIEKWETSKTRMIWKESSIIAQRPDRIQCHSNIFYN